MKIAIFSDIHGNDIAFESAVNHAKAQGAEMFIIAGDLITDYPLSSAVIARARDLTTNIVRGNRDQEVEEYDRSGYTHLKEYKQFGTLVWALDHLRPDEYSFIQSLPEKLTVSLDEENSILVVHGSPSSITEGLDPSKNMDSLIDAVNHISETIVVCGHTHSPWVGNVGDKYFINAGSVGFNFSGDFLAEYVLLNYEAGEITAQVNKVRYDAASLRKITENTGILEYAEAKYWIQLLFQSQADGVNHLNTLFSLSAELKKEYGYTDFRYIPNEIWDRIIEMFKQRNILCY